MVPERKVVPVPFCSTVPVPVIAPEMVLVPAAIAASWPLSVTALPKVSVLARLMASVAPGLTVREEEDEMEVPGIVPLPSCSVPGAELLNL